MGLSVGKLFNLGDDDSTPEVNVSVNNTKKSQLSRR